METIHGNSSLGTFNPMFPIGNYFGVLADTGPGPVNFIDVHPRLQTWLPHGVSISTDVVVQWRESLHDGVYAVPGFLLVPAGDSRATVRRISARNRGAMADRSSCLFAGGLRSILRRRLPEAGVAGPEHQLHGTLGGIQILMERISGKSHLIQFINRHDFKALRRERIVKIAIGFVLSFIIGAGCRYFDIPAASPPVIPGALIVLAMTLGYSSMDRVLIRKGRAATTKHLCGGPTGLPTSIASSRRPSQPEGQARS